MHLRVALGLSGVTLPEPSLSPSPATPDETTRSCRKELAGLFGYLPDAPTLERESLMTSPIRVNPSRLFGYRDLAGRRLYRLSRPQIFFTAMMLKLTVLGVVSGAVTSVSSENIWFRGIFAKLYTSVRDCCRPSEGSTELKAFQVALSTFILKL